MLNRLTHLPREARDTLFLLTVIAWVLGPQLGHLPAWCAALAAGVLAWRGWLAWHSRPLPGRWWLLGLLALTLGATLATHRTLLGRDAGVTLIVVLLALKTLELRARRDAFVVFFLGFFTMLTNFFYSQSLLTAAAMLVALLGLLAALVNAHLPVGQPPLSQALKTAAWMALLGAPIMAMLFVLFPRFAPLWGIPSDAMTGRSGLSSSMEVGNVARLALDDSIALRLKFDGAPPALADMYLRGPVLSRFDGREWRPLSSSRPGFAGRSGLRVGGPAVAYEVTLEPSSRPWLFVLEAAARAPELPGFEVRMTEDLQWLADRPITDLVRYRAESYPRFGHGPLSPRGQALIDLQPYLALPADFNPRTLQLAAELRQATPDTQGLVQAALQRLREGGYTYTLEPGVTGRHSADEFWFDTKAGFCEHIASAFVVLMRAAGVPARVVTGYQGGQFNPVDGFWTVRQSDAHAWTEVWLAERGWARVDPTSAVAPGRTGTFRRLAPPQGAVTAVLGNLSPGLATQLRHTWEALNNGWNQWVLNYTQGKQLDLLKRLGFASPSWQDLGLLLIACLVAASLAGTGWSLWERRQHDPWLRLLARARQRLDDAGLASAPSAPPRALAQAVLRGPWTEAQRRALHDWLLQLEHCRYAPAAAGEQRARLATLRKAFRRLPWPQ